MREECKLCGRIMPYYSLKQCYKCRQLYCKNCILTGRDAVPLLQEGNVICLNCARKLITSKTPANKFDLLRNHLKYRASFTNRITLSFAKIEGIISDNLPFAAIRNENWWTNTNSAHARAWLNAGWKVENVSLKDRNVTFMRMPGLMETERKRRKRKEDTAAWAMKLAQMAKPRTIKTPSKTKIAKVQARLKNIEQRQSSIRSFRGKFKQKPAHEKRLFKPEAKPSTQDS